MAVSSQGAREFGHRRNLNAPTPAARAEASKNASRSSYSMTALFEQEGRQRLMLLGGAALFVLLGVWAYVYFTSKPTMDGKIFTSLDECSALGAVSPEDCEGFWKTAEAAHMEVAPVYATRENCERRHGAGRCSQAERAASAERHSRFVPAMSAFLFTLDDGGAAKLTPLYRDPGDGPDQWRQVMPVAVEKKP